MVAHALGAGAVPADLEGAGFEVVVATDAEAALACAGSAARRTSPSSTGGSKVTAWPSANGCGLRTRVSPCCSSAPTTRTS